MGGKWGVMAGGGANDKNCGAMVDWFGFPIFPHFPQFSTISPGSPHFSSGAFTNTPPPPPESPVGPNFSHHKARVQAVGWFPLGTRK